jgi:hypothetical protein
MPYAGNLGNALVSALIAAASFSRAPAPLRKARSICPKGGQVMVNGDLTSLHRIRVLPN